MNSPARITPSLTTGHQSPTPYFSNGAGTRVLVTPTQRTQLDAIKALSAKPSSAGYHALAMTKAVERLRSGGDLPNSQIMHGNPRRRCLVYSGFEIEYEVSPGVFGQGTIEIVEIRHLDLRAHGESRSGMWEAKFSKAKGRWEASQWLPSLSSVNENSTLKVGINGYSGDRHEAADLMSKHVSRGDSKKIDALKNTGYHLFYSPTTSTAKAGWQWLVNCGRVHKPENSIESAQILAAYMHEAHQKQLKIEWTSHRGGAFVLTEAMKLLAQKNIDLQQRQSIFLSDNSTSQAVADRYRRQLNMDISDAKWINEGYGIGHLAGGSLFGLANIQTELTVIKKDTPAEERWGKRMELAFDTAKRGKGTLLTGAAAVALYSQFGVSMAFAAALIKILPTLAASVPSLADEYQKGPHQALGQGANKIMSHLRRGNS